jgi:hypothetical protein
METTPAPAQPGITSFVVRFVYAESPLPQDGSASSSSKYRGTIRHIQSDEEIAFTHWEDALRFMQRFVPVTLNDPSSSADNP